MCAEMEWNMMLRSVQDHFQCWDSDCRPPGQPLYITVTLCSSELFRRMEKTVQLAQCAPRQGLLSLDDLPEHLWLLPERSLYLAGHLFVALVLVQTQAFAQHAESVSERDRDVCPEVVNELYHAVSYRLGLLCVLQILREPDVESCIAVWCDIVDTGAVLNEIKEHRPTGTFVSAIDLDGVLHGEDDRSETCHAAVNHIRVCSSNQKLRGCKLEHTSESNRRVTHLLADLATILPLLECVTRPNIPNRAEERC